jgi:tetratricopeptide (TPR) repeat protein
MSLGNAVVGLAAVMSVAVLPFRASAQEDGLSVDEARTRFELAERHFDEGEYALALAEFERVHELMEAAGHPNAIYVVYNIAFANERLGREAAAVEAYERFLAESAPDAPNRENAQRQLRELRLRLELAAADRRSDDARAGASRDGTGGGLTISPVGSIVAAVGGASVMAGAVVGAVALMESQRAQESCIDASCPAAVRGELATAHTLANASDGLLFGGLAVAATGVVLMFVLPGAPDESAASVSVGCTHRGCSAAVRGRF